MPGGDDDTGKVEINLPGGIGAKIAVPGGLDSDGTFDIAGVGLYPGAKVGSVKVDAAASPKSRKATVAFGFSARADAAAAAAAADWYQREFDVKGTKVTRRSETLSGLTGDGDDFTIAMEAVATGTSRGLVTITDAN